MATEDEPVEDVPDAIVEEPRSRFPYRLVAFAVAALVLFPLLAQSGVWDPYELDSADLARRIAVHVFHATSLELPNGVNALPTLTDLKGGELGFTSMALGFKLFGLHDWSGRLPLALWAFAGVVALYELLARNVSPKAGLYAALALVTMPLFFMQARTMLGDAVTMSAAILAFAGLLGAILEESSGAIWFAWLGTASVGLVAGYLARGLLLGVAAPALAAGAAWLALSFMIEGRWRFDARELLGLGTLLLGVAATIAGVVVLLRAKDDVVLRAVGFSVAKKPVVEDTFNLPIRLLGHGLFPWSALLPFAIGRLFRAPVEAPLDRRDRETGVRVGLLVGASVAFAAYSFLSPYSGELPFAGVALLAGIVGVAVHDFERSEQPSYGLAVGVVLLAAVLYHDLSVEPEKALACFVIDKASFPKSFEGEATKILRITTLGFIALVSATWFEPQPVKRPDGFLAWLRETVDEHAELANKLTRIWNGNLLFGLVVIEAAFVGLGAMIFVGRHLHWPPVEALGKNFVDVGLNAWWILPLLVAGARPGYVVVRDAVRGFFAMFRIPRALGTVAAAALVGVCLSFWYYPALAAQLSPKEVFASYTKLAKPGEPLALLGVRNRAASYYSGADVESFTDASRAFDWLTQRMDTRRFLVVKADDLPKLNSLYRQKAAHNLPVLDGKSSQILLVSNELGDHDNESWLKDMVLDTEPSPVHRVRAVFEDQLETIGWEVRDKHGELVDSVSPVTAYRLRIYYRVLKPITGSWKAFTHVDGEGRRYNGDHAVLDGKYPMNLWQPGDIIMDDSELQLEPNFTPADYTLYFGFFSGEPRFKVTSGPQQDNRVVGGVLKVH